VIVKSLQAGNFRNIRSADVEFSETFNFIVGGNAQGKTNLLEALHMFSLGRSFRTTRSDDLITFGEDFLFLKLRGLSDSGVGFTLDLGLERGGRVVASANGGRLPGLSEIIGMIPSVIFAPGDVELSSGPPSGRRLYMDYTAAQVSPPFLSDLKEYRRALGQRNVLLKRIQGEARERRAPEAGRSHQEQLDAWDAMLAEKGAGVAAGRREILSAAAPVARGMFAEMAPGSGDLGLSYHCSFDEEAGDRASIKEALLAALLRGREADRRKGYTGTGPHCDDMTIRLGDVDLRRFGSQGRKRLAAISLKLAQAEVIMERRSERPVVLLDDIFSELDSETACRVRGLLSGRYQSFVTSPKLSDLGECPGGGIVINVENGVLIPGKRA